MRSPGGCGVCDSVNVEWELGEQAVGYAGTGRLVAGRGGGGATNEEGVQHSEERITERLRGLS